MNSALNHLNNRLLVPVKNWINKVIAGRRDDDDHFNHPFAIF
jgi:hypothetical protein